MRLKHILLSFIICLSACQQLNVAEFSTTPETIRSETTNPTLTPSILLTTPTKISTQTKSPTADPSETPTSSSTPVIIVPFLDGSVNEQASCRYGPGAAYLFEWGLYPKDSVRILNRNWDGTWVYIKPITYNNECWVKASLLNYEGEGYSLEEYYSPLPYVYTYLYQPVKYVIVERIGDEVIITWDPVKMTEDDDRGYLIEAWVCQEGKFVFLPINIFPYTNNSVKIKDGPGCVQESNARFYTVEKHGYMPFIEIPWPAYK